MMGLAGQHAYKMPRLHYVKTAIYLHLSSFFFVFFLIFSKIHCIFFELTLRDPNKTTKGRASEVESNFLETESSLFTIGRSGV